MNRTYTICMSVCAHKRHCREGRKGMRTITSAGNCAGRSAGRRRSALLSQAGGGREGHAEMDGRARWRATVRRGGEGRLIGDHGCGRWWAVVGLVVVVEAVGEKFRLMGGWLVGWLVDVSVAQPL